jgi:predicted transposase YbfD/YdcC
MVKSYIPVVADYMFSNKTVDDFRRYERMVIDYHIDCITSHNIGGKAMEKFNDYQFGFKPWNDSIFDFDSMHTNGRPIEQKLETVNDSKKLQFCSSFPEHRENTPIKSDLFKEKHPYMMNTAVCDITGKVLWVALTDTDKIPHTSDFWVRLTANAPRLSFASYNAHPESVEFLYVNETLCNQYKDNSIRNYAMIATDVWNLLTERKYVNA